MERTRINIDYSRPCRDCGVVVVFSDSIRTPAGSRIPLNTDLTNHHCTTNEEYLVSQAVEYVRSINRRLTTCELALSRKDKI